MRRLSYAALWIFVFTVPWLGVVLTSGVARLNKLTGMLALGLALLGIALSGRIRRWDFFHIAALLFVIYAALEFFLFHTREEMPNKFWTFVQLFLVLIAVWELAPYWRQQRGLLTAYVIGAYVAALSNILLFRTQGAALARVAAGGADPNDLAMTLVLALPIAWFLGMTSRRPFVRWVCRAYLPIGLFSIALTASRGGMLASMVGLLIVPLTMTKLSPGKLAVGIAMLAIGGALAVRYVPDQVVERLATTGTSVQHLSFGGRFRLWKAGVHAFTEKPVFGWGTGGYKMAIMGELGHEAQVAHNSFLSVLVEQGIIGFFLFALILIGVLRAVVTLPSFERRFALTLLATLMVTMLPLTWEDSKPAWIVMALLVGVARTEITRMGGVMPEPVQRRPPPRAYWQTTRRPLTVPERSPQPDPTA